VLQSDGTLNRSALGRIVFADAEARRDLERIIHPIVYRGISDWFMALPARTSFAIADVPLLYEGGREGDFDAVIVTSCRPELQVERLVTRNGLTEAEARQRIAAQMPTAEKAARATYVVDTSADFGDTNRQIEEIANRLSAKRARAPR
jgi:dephospho-CoA kinase